MYVNEIITTMLVSVFCGQGYSGDILGTGYLIIQLYCPQNFLHLGSRENNFQGGKLTTWRFGFNNYLHVTAKDIKKINQTFQGKTRQLAIHDSRNFRLFCTHDSCSLCLTKLKESSKD